MPKSSLALKAAVTRRQAKPIPSDMTERLEQLRHHQDAENAAVRPNEGATALEPEKAGFGPVSSRPISQRPRRGLVGRHEGKM